MTEVIVCTPKSLPVAHHEAAAQCAVEINPMNRPNVGGILRVGAPAHLERALITYSTTRWWGNVGVQLTVGFLDGEAADLRERILSHMNAWSASANVSFVEAATDPQVRIARIAEGDDRGYWSYIGTDIKQAAADEPTMNLQGFTMETPESEYHRVVRHETGHTLGFVHEHLRRELVDKIDPDRAIAYYQLHDNWSPEQTRSQVLTPLEEGSIHGGVIDPNSIMCYQIPGSITKDGNPIIGGTDIDNQDYAMAKEIYPKVTAT